MDFRTPVARARGLGAAHHGSSHWWLQRITALVLVPLACWFLSCLAQLPNAEYQIIHAWFHDPVNSVLILAFMLTALYHGALGLQVILEDYIHTRAVKYFAIALTHMLLVAAGMTGVLATLYLLFSR